MCGIAGYLTTNGELHPSSMAKMTGALWHRGPDDSSTWSDLERGIVLGHRRLAIVDLTSAGKQPMASASGRYVIVFNGEIYNHATLRREIQASRSYAWRSHSDTETLLAAFETWGIKSAIEKSVGMFAIAVWDRAEQRLTLIRDRLGEKPVYYGWQGNSFLFASELGAIEAHPSFADTLDRDALTQYVRFGYVPAPLSIYKRIKKLQPGTLVSVSLKHREPAAVVYWSAANAANEGASRRFTGTESEAVEELEVKLKESIQLQMLADVPVGAFLSGGVDSSTIVALMQSQSTRPVKTYTIGYAERGHSEADRARAVAAHLKTEHTELIVSAADALAVVPRLSTLYSEPFADSSQLPTFLVSQLARGQVTVSLSGDGGDEVFCGYNRYDFVARYWVLLSRLPLALRRIVSSAILSRPPEWWSKKAAFLPWTSVGDKLHKSAGVLDCESVGELYSRLVSLWDAPTDVTLGGSTSTMQLPSQELHGLTDAEKMMVYDMMTYLADDILVKVDRAAMGVSLESRAPMLDHRLVEFAWTLPLKYKFQNGTTKWALRQVLYKHVPRELIDRPKAGFAFPIDLWLRSSLKDWANELLDPIKMQSEGFFNVAEVQRKWREHQSGTRNWASQLWAILMFEGWLAR